jgi:hypothetical protein
MTSYRYPSMASQSLKPGEFFYPKNVLHLGKDGLLRPSYEIWRQHRKIAEVRSPQERQMFIDRWNGRRAAASPWSAAELVVYA